MNTKMYVGNLSYDVENSDDEAEQAILSLNETDFMGRSLVVNIARPRENRNARY